MEQLVGWYPNTYALISLGTSVLPAAVGLYAWRRRGKPGAATLTASTCILALWGLLYAAELGATNADTVGEIHEMRAMVFVAVAPLWLVFVLQYTGRERWLTLPFTALLFAVPAVTLALILTNENHGLVWTSEGVRREGVLLLADFVNGAWFWVDLAYAALLVLAGAVLLAIMLANSQRVYAKQSADLLIGVVGPWVSYAAYASGLDSGLDALPGLDPTVLVFVPAGFALAWGLYRHGLLDISPVAHDAVIEGMSDGTLVLDRRNRIVDLNPAAVRILGCGPEKVVGRGFREVMNGKAAPLSGGRGSALLERYEQHGQAHEEVTFGKGADARHYDLALSALYDGRGGRTGHLVVLHEITEKKLAVERLDRLAHYDALTGLPNRAFFYERLSQEVARASRPSTAAGAERLLALMFLDLDRFKMINDTLGHEVGDLLLQETARRLRASVREYDVVARLAGDEFVVILPEVSGVEDATGVASRVIESINEPLVLDGDELTISTSVGICFYPTDGQDPTTLVKNADAAMYRAKGGGKNRYEIFTGDALQNPIKHLELESELNRAVEEDQFVLYYQPEIQVLTSHVVGVETSVRWEHPERGLVGPKEFISVAEETGLIFAIERWVLREACRQMRSWQERYPTETPLTTSVNISKRHFMHPNLSGVVHRVLEETKLPPECLVLEIKEGILHEDAASAAATLGALKRLGVKIAVDNFGAGYSSLTQLKKFPLDMLKIDPSFVRAFHESEEDREIVAAIITLGHALGLKVVAEGVENPRQLVQLKEMGCEIAQGRYFADSLSHRATSAFLVADLYY